MFCLSSLVGLAISSPATAAAPDPALVARIERSVTLPAGAGALDSYDRYYAPGVFFGRKAIVGVYLATYVGDHRVRFQRGEHGAQPRPSERKGRVRLVAEAAQLPEGIMDGGCAEIHIAWDLAASRILTVQCNGLA